MKKLKSIIGYGALIAVIGLLVFGAVNRTLAKSESLEVEDQSSVITGDVYGNGNGNSGEDSGNDNDNSNEDVQDSSDLEVDHDTLSYSLESLPVGEVNQDEIDAMLYMREEEKLARDVYTYLYEQWDLPVFANISSSEQTHMDAVLDLLNRYGLTDSASDQAGVFNNADLQNLYTQLIAKGSQSLEEAFTVGAAIEEIDILDLQERLTLTDQEDIRQVFENLLNGSYNHLNSFVGNLENRTGSIYVPQYLSVDQYEAILSTDSTTNGSGSGSGGSGNGNGRR